MNIHSRNAKGLRKRCKAYLMFSVENQRNRSTWPWKPNANIRLPSRRPSGSAAYRGP